MLGDVVVVLRIFLVVICLLQAAYIRRQRKKIQSMVAEYEGLRNRLTNSKKGGEIVG